MVPTQGWHENSWSIPYLKKKDYAEFSHHDQTRNMLDNTAGRDSLLQQSFKTGHMYQQVLHLCGSGSADTDTLSWTTELN